ncbi:MAG: hypothetical protein HDT44_02865 [Ruminococcaceae bacterium]|nr:hypothetical protein [Oscillospiraceae bacterium]
MRSRAKSNLFIFIIIASLLFCGGCDGNNILNQLDETDISYIMKTDLSCFNGEELYIKTPFYPSSDILIRYGNPVYFDGRRLYFFRYSITEAETSEEKAESGNTVTPRTAVIACFDTEKGETELILEEENKKHISYSFAAFKDSFLYYYRAEQDSGGEAVSDAALYRINVDEKKAERIAEASVINGALPKQKGVWAGESLYFEQIAVSDDPTDSALYSYIYSYNTRNGEYKEFKRGIHNLMRYGDKIAYIKDVKVCCCDPSGENETEIYAPDESDNIAFYSNGEKIFYQQFVSDGEKNSVETGYISGGKKKKIGWNIKKDGRFSLMEGETMFLMTVSGGDNIVYDNNHGCFARISLNRENHRGYPAEDSVMFVCYDGVGQNPVFYLYSREKIKGQLPAALNAPKENMLERP